MSRKLLTGRCLDIANSTTVDEFRRHVTAAANDLGFSYFSGSVVIDHAPNVTEFLVIRQIPAEYETSHMGKATTKWDPPAQHCKRSSELIAWDQSTYTSEGLGDCWEHQARFGFLYGVGMATHLPLGRHYLFGVDGDRPLPRSRRAREKILRDFETLMAHAQDAAFHILAPETRPAVEGRPLDAAEIEVLRWSMEGLSPDEIADVMNLSDAHVRRCLQNAVVKLGCVSKHQAVLLAIRQRLLA